MRSGSCCTRRGSTRSGSTRASRTATWTGSTCLRAGRARSAARCPVRAAAATSCCSRASTAVISSRPRSRSTAARSCPSSSSDAGCTPGPRAHAEAGARLRVGLLGPLAPWRGGLAQYLGLLGDALRSRAEVRGWTFTRQYPGFLFPGESQLDPAMRRPDFPIEATLDSIAPPSWRRTAAALERFAPGAIVLKWWIPFFAPSFASAVGPLRRRGTRVVLVCDNLIPHEHRPFDGVLTRWMLRNSDGYLVMSESVERDLDRLKPGAPRRRVLHPLYAQFDRGRHTKESARAALGLAGDVVLFFGYVRRYKGLD